MMGTIAQHTTTHLLSTVVNMTHRLSTVVNTTHRLSIAARVMTRRTNVATIVRTMNSTATISKSGPIGKRDVCVEFVLVLVNFWVIFLCVCVFNILLFPNTTKIDTFDLYVS